MHGEHEGGDGETRGNRRRRREKCEYYEEEHKRDDDGKGTASKGRVRRGGKIDLEQTNDLPETIRGEGGFGSTGK